MKEGIRIRRKKTGGFKKKNDAVSSFDAVLSMIRHPDSVLTHLSYSSLSGFLFRLDSPVHSEFLGLNKTGTQLNSPIHSLVLKIALVSNRNKNAPHVEPLVVEFGGTPVEKKVELLHHFAEECKKQQNIYLKTLPPAGNPICPAVVDFSYFDRSAAAFDFINLLKRKLKKSNDTKALAMLIYLQSRISEHIDDVNLGIISMELADPTSNDPFVTLKAMKKSTLSESQSNRSKSTSSASTFQKTCQRSLAQIIIMFVKLKLINTDCHSGNILGNENLSYLIDFGRTVHVDRKVTIPPPEDIIDIDITDLYANDTNHRKPDNHNSAKKNHIIDMIEKIVTYILKVDMFVNNRDKPQMYSLMQYFYDDDSDRHAEEEGLSLNREKLATVIPIIRDLTETPIKAVNAISRRAIQNMVHTGRIFSIGDNPITTFDRSNTVITQEPQSSSSSTTPWAASIINDVFPAKATDEAALPSAMVRPTDATRRKYIEILKHDFKGFHDDKVEIKDFSEIFQEVLLHERRGTKSVRDKSSTTEIDTPEINTPEINTPKINIVDRILDKLKTVPSTKDKRDILYYTAWFLHEKSAKFRETYVKGFMRDASITMSGDDVLNLVYMMVGQTLASSREQAFIVGNDLLQLLLRQSATTTSSQRSRRKRKNPSDNHHDAVLPKRKTSSRRQISRHSSEDSVTQPDITVP